MISKEKKITYLLILFDILLYLHFVFILFFLFFFLDFLSIKSVNVAFLYKYILALFFLQAYNDDSLFLQTFSKMFECE